MEATAVVSRISRWDGVRGGVTGSGEDISTISYHPFFGACRISGVTEIQGGSLEIVAACCQQ
jgi:hypothetical protein